MKAEGTEVRNKGRETRVIQTTNGPLAIRRSVLRVTGEARKAAEASFAEEEERRGKEEGEKFRMKGIIPLDEYLGIDNLPFKMSRPMMEEMAFLGAHESSYKEAEIMAQKFYDTGVTDSLIREVTEWAGEKVYYEDWKRSRDIEENMKKIPDEGEKEGILYGFADGSMINTRIRNKDGSTWKEDKLGEMYGSEDIKKRKSGKACSVERKEYVDVFGSVEEFKALFFDAAIRNGYGKYKTTVMISDGAAWIHKMWDELFPDAVQILDLFHVKENIYSFGKLLFKGDASKYKPWAEDIIALVDAGKTEEALGKLKPYEKKKFNVPVVNPYHYIKTNQERMNYPLYRSLGYMVGSGPIESGTKSVVQRRCKQPGMRWNVPTAQHVLSLRAKMESGLWISFVSPLLQAA
jgi:hypothetical protein